MPQWRHKYEDIIYALHELLILERNARKLSLLEVDLRYSNEILSNKTDYNLYLAKLIILHSNCDLRSIPRLLAPTIIYFNKFPDSLNYLSTIYPNEVQKFRLDFGFYN